MLLKEVMSLYYILYILTKYNLSKYKKILLQQLDTSNFLLKFSFKQAIFINDCILENVIQLTDKSKKSN